MMRHRFMKTGRDWYIDLPEFLEQGGNIGDLQMVDGADIMLDIIARNETEVTLQISKDEFDGADVLTLPELCDPDIGGGYYFLKTFEGELVNRTMWLCQVTEFVLGDIPSHIFIKRD